MQLMPCDVTDVVVVTGASSGIGHACTLHLAKAGCTVFAGYRQPEDGDKLRGMESGRVIPIRLDISEEADLDALTDRLDTHLDKSPGNCRLAGLVNNAGIGMVAPMAFAPLDDLRRILEINVIGQVAMIQRLIVQLRAHEGRVVNISSVSGRVR